MLLEHGTHLAHPAESWQAWSVEAPLVGRGQHDVDLAPLPLPESDDLVLQEEVLAAVVREDDNQRLR